MANPLIPLAARLNPIILTIVWCEFRVGKVVHNDGNAEQSGDNSTAVQRPFWSNQTVEGRGTLLDVQGIILFAFWIQHEGEA